MERQPSFGAMNRGNHWVDHQAVDSSNFMGATQFQNRPFQNNQVYGNGFFNIGQNNLPLAAQG